ncbi:putative acyltransferase ChoActase/COT/CPT, choline/carnitine acyltransferase [Plasmopara halstedii]
MQRIGRNLRFMRVLPLRPLPARFGAMYSTAGVQQPGWFNRMLLTNEYNLPRLPVPQLERTVQRYLETVRPLVTTKDWEIHSELANSFKDNEGRQLQEILLKRELKQATSRSYPFSYIEEEWDKMYLEGRYENPIHVNPSYGLIEEPDGNLQGMVSRSAAFVRSMVKWWTKVKNSDLEQDKNQCMAGFARQYGTAKVPKKDSDILKSHPRATHIVVLTNFDFFKLDVLSPDGKQLLTQRQLEEQLDYTLNSSLLDDYNKLDLSTLTAEKRDTWAQIREDLVMHHPLNAETLEVIDSALFILVLEHRNPSDASQCIELSLHGQGRHRWFDKLQVMVQPNGHLSINFEHSFSDGTVWNRWLQECWHDMRGSDSGFASLKELPEYTGATKPKKLSWKLSNNLVEEVKQAESHFADFAGNLNLEYLVYTNFAKSNCKQWQLSPDGIAQMALQLAFYRTHGKIAPTYESCSTRLFHHGRTETIRSATPVAEAFVKSVENDVDKKAQRELLFAAVRRHVKMAKAAQKGFGVDRHLTALNSIANLSGISSKFLTSPVRAESMRFLISSSNVTMPFLNYFSFGAVVPHGYGVGYLLHDKSINISLTNFKNSQISDGGAMKLALKSSLDTIKALADYPVL